MTEPNYECVYVYFIFLLIYIYLYIYIYIYIYTEIYRYIDRDNKKEREGENYVVSLILTSICNVKTGKMFLILETSKLVH